MAARILTWDELRHKSKRFPVWLSRGNGYDDPTTRGFVNTVHPEGFFAGIAECEEIYWRINYRTIHHRYEPGYSPWLGPDERPWNKEFVWIKRPWYGKFCVVWNEEPTEEQIRAWKDEVRKRCEDCAAGTKPTAGYCEWCPLKPNN